MSLFLSSHSRHPSNPIDRLLAVLTKHKKASKKSPVHTKIPATKTLKKNKKTKSPHCEKIRTTWFYADVIIWYIHTKKIQSGKQILVHVLVARRVPRSRRSDPALFSFSVIYSSLSLLGSIRLCSLPVGQPRRHGSRAGFSLGDVGELLHGVRGFTNIGRKRRRRAARRRTVRGTISRRPA